MSNKIKKIIAYGILLTDIVLFISLLLQVPMFLEALILTITLLFIGIITAWAITILF